MAAMSKDPSLFLLQRERSLDFDRKRPSLEILLGFFAIIAKRRGSLQPLRWLHDIGHGFFEIVRYDSCHHATDVVAASNNLTRLMRIPLCRIV